MSATGRFRLLIGVCFVAGVAADVGGDLANNLPTDLAPLLSLFGERATMQFMSQSMGWTDHIMLAMAPLGIITAVVCAIRVGGPSWLKAIIGRARETRAAAEIELMSSTSHEVCELWNGQGIVRVMGKGLIRGFIVMVRRGSGEGGKGDEKNNKCAAADRNNLEIKGVVPVMELGDQDYIDDRGPTLRERILGRYIEQEDGPLAQVVPSPVIIRHTETDHEGKHIPPNLSFNVHSQVGRRDQYAVASFGILLQLSILVYFACATYYPPLRFYLLKNDNVVENYAFPCAAAGTILIASGMLICSVIVEKSTSEKRYRPRHKTTEARVVWLQRSGVVSDQAFGSFAIYPLSPQALITTSRRVEGKFSEEVLTLLGTFFSVSGFVVQFVGLRAMHWTASVALFGATILMTVLRVLVRRNLANPPASQPLVSGHELDWLAMTFAEHLKDAPWLIHSEPGDIPGRPWAVAGGWDWGIVGVEDPAKCKGLKRAPDTNGGESSNSLPNARRVMKIRRDLGKLVDWRGPAYAEAVALVRAIQVTMDILYHSIPAGEALTWSLPVLNSLRDSDREPITFHVKRQANGNWEAYHDEIEAALSLWLYSVDEYENPPRQAEKNRGTAAKRSLRLLDSHTPALQRDLRWWMPGGAVRVIQVKQHKTPTSSCSRTVEVDTHRIVGYASNWSSRWFTKPRPLYAYPFPSEGTPVHPEGDGAFLAVESYSPLKTLFAQHMFSAFMWAAAKKMDIPFHGQAGIRPAETGVPSRDSWQSITLENDQLSKMVQDIQSTGLGSLEEIYIAIIPPLSAENKLPLVDAIIEWAREQAKPYEHRGHWEKAADVYLWLFQELRTIPEQSNRATAVLMEYLRTITLAIELSGAQAYPEGDSQGLQKLKSSLEKELQKARPDILLSLMRLYEEQDRRWKCDIVQSTESGAEEYAEDFNFTSLHEFTRRRDIKGIKEVLREANPRDIHGWTPLHYAAAKGFKDAADELLRGGAEVNAQDLLECTPLHYVAANGHDAVVGLLLNNRADQDARDRFNRTPLHYAAANGRDAVVGLLLNKRADLDARDCSGGTPLHYAAANRRDAVVGLLLNKRADLDARDHSGGTPVHSAAKAGHEATVEQLLNHLEFDDSSKSDLTQEVLFWAAENGYQPIVRLLLTSRKVTVNPKSETDQTPLSYAASNGHEAIVKLLLASKDIDINSKSKSDQTPLSYAAANGHEAIVKLLLASKDIVINSKSKSDQTPLSYAAANGHEAIVKLLLASKDIVINSKEKYFSQTPLSYAAANGHEAIVKLLLASKDIDINSKSKSDQTPLSYAAANGHEAIVKLLRAHEEGDVNPGKILEALPNMKPVTAPARFDSDRFLAAASITWHGQVRYKAGQSHTLPYFHDRNRLADAVFYGEWDKVKKLLSESSDKYKQNWVNCWRILPSTEKAKTPSGFTPLHQAAWWGNEQAVEELLTMGAWRLARTLRNTSNSKGKSRPLDIARDRGREHLYKSLNLDPDIERRVDHKIIQALQRRLHDLIEKTFRDNDQADLECFALPELEILTEIEKRMWFPLNPELPDTQAGLGVHIGLENDELVVITQGGRGESRNRNYRISFTGVQEM